MLEYDIIVSGSRRENNLIYNVKDRTFWGKSMDIFGKGNISSSSNKGDWIRKNTKFYRVENFKELYNTILNVIINNRR